uniref:Uncharacterized protein n=1 Tax=Sipha flava TaxID=143950 RepID=A0A2S2QXN2_9HEMI
MIVVYVVVFALLKNSQKWTTTVFLLYPSYIYIYMLFKYGSDKWEWIHDILRPGKIDVAHKARFSLLRKTLIHTKTVFKNYKRSGPHEYPAIISIHPLPPACDYMYVPMQMRGPSPNGR